MVSWFVFRSSYASLLILSMLPLIELRGAILFGAAIELPMLPVFLLSVIGNLLPIPFVILFSQKILSMLKHLPFLSDITTAYENKVVRKSQQMEHLTFWGLVAFVAIPLPGTGAWTGSFIAAMLKIPLRKALPAIIIGVWIAGMIMTAASYGLVGIFNWAL